MKTPTMKTLAKAMKPCPQRWYFDGEPLPRDGPGCDHPDECKCKGTNEVAMFEGFRQECHQAGNHRYMAGMPEGGSAPDGAICADCKATPGYKVRAGGLGDGLAGLEPRQAHDVLVKLASWTTRFHPDGPMPGRSYIDAEGLSLVSDIANVAGAE